MLTEWMDRTLKQGYLLQFSSTPPPFTSIKEAKLSSQREIGFLSTEVQTLVQKQVVSVVRTQDRERGHYSLYFLVPKKTGEFRPILDLRGLNLYIVRKTFQMLTVKRLLELVQPGDWFTTIDLKDAYFHVGIAPKHRKYLRFAFRGWPTSTTGCRSATPCPRARSASAWRWHSSRCASIELYDILHITGNMSYGLIDPTSNRVGICGKLGEECPMPQQQVLYLGVVLDAGRLRTTLSESRQASLLQAVCRLRQGATVTALTVMQTLGLMAAAHVVVPLGLLHMRRLQRWFSSLCLDLKKHKRRLVTIPPLGEGPSPEGIPAGTGDFPHLSVHGCVRNGMGRNPPRGSCRRLLVSDRDAAHQPHRAAGSDISSPSFQTLNSGETCNGQGRQQHHSGIYQQTGRSPLRRSVDHGGEIVVMGC